MKRVMSFALTLLVLVALMMGILPAALPALANGGVPVSVNAPPQAAPGADFVASVDIGAVTNFDAGNFDVAFDPTVLEIVDITPGVDITNGDIGGTAIPVVQTNIINNGSGPGDLRVVTVVVNVDGTPGVTGSGKLADLNFHVLGSDGDSSVIGLANGVLGDNLAAPIAATWAGYAVNIVALPPSNYTVSGVISEIGTGTLLAGVSVWLFDPQNEQNFPGGPSAGDGTYSITAPDGNYQLKVAKPGHISHIEALNLSTDMPNTDIVLVPGLIVSGKVTEFGTGNNIPGVNVSAYDTVGEIYYYSMPTDANGDYSVTVPAGDYVLKAGKPGYVVKKKSITVAGNMTENIVLKKGFVVSGVITDASNQQLLAGVDVKLYDSALAKDFIGSPTDASGAYSRTVPSANYNLMASLTGYIPFTKGIFVGSNLTEDIALAPEQAGALHHFEFDVIGNQMAGTPFSVTITAKDSTNALVDTYTGTNNLSDLTGTIEPGQTGAFVAGVWIGDVTIEQALDADVINTSGGGTGGSSNTFDVGGFHIESQSQQSTFMMSAGGTIPVDVDVTSIGGFAGQVDLVFYGPPALESASSVLPTSVILTASGTETVALTLGADAQTPPGTYNCSLEGTSNGIEAEYFMTVNVGVAGQPLLSAQPAVVSAGDTTVFSVFQFPADTAIEVRWNNGPLVGTGGELLASGTVLGDGSWASSAVAITGMPTGNFEVKAIADTTVAYFMITILGTGAGPDFLVNLSPDFLSLQPGANTNVIVTVQSVNNFSSPVTFSGTPSGITLTFNPTSVTPSPNGQATTTMTVTLADWVPPDMYHVGVHCQSQDPQIEKFRDLNLDVAPPADWGPSISLSQSYGKPGDVVTITGSNFTQSTLGSEVTIREMHSNSTISTQPATVTIVTGGTFSAQITVPDVPGGQYRLEAKVAASGEFAEKDFEIVATGATYTISASPMSTNVVTESGSNSSTVSLNLFSVGGSSPMVGLSIENPPWWLTYKFGSLADNTPATGDDAIDVPAGGSTSIDLALTVALTAPTGNYLIPVKSAASTPIYVEIELIVMPPSDYGMASVTLSPEIGAVGDNVVVTGWGFTPSANITELMFAGDNLLAAPIPISSTGSFSTQITVPNQVWGGTATGSGMYPIDVLDAQGVWGGAEFMVMEAGQKYTLSANPDWLPPIYPGSSGTTTVKVKSMGTAVTVDLVVKGMPPGIDWTFSGGGTTEQVTVSPGGSTTTVLTLTPTNIPPGHYGADIKGISADQETHWAHIEFDIKGPEGFTFPEILLNPDRGAAGDKVTIFGTDFNQGDEVTEVKFAGTAVTIPAGITADASGNFTLVFTVPTIGGGMYPVEVTCGGLHIEKPFDVRASDASFGMWADPGWLGKIQLDDTRDTTIRMESWATAATVNLSMPWVPMGITANFVDSAGTLLGQATSVTVPAGGQSSVILRVDPQTIPPGWYSIEVKGVSGAATMFAYVDFEIGSGDFMDQTWMQEQGIYYPEISLNPDRGKTGTSVTVQGSGFPPTGTITSLKFAGQSQTIPTGGSAVTVDASGGFTMIIKIPDNAPWGWHPVDVEITKDATIWPAWRDVEVVAADAAFGMWADPGWLGMLDIGDTADSRINVESWGSAVDVDLSLGWVPPGINADFLDSTGASVGATTTVSAPAGGKSGATLRIEPQKIPPGWYSIEVKGVAGAAVMFAYVDFEIGMGKFMDQTWMTGQGLYYPDIALRPDRGKAGEKVTVTGTGFPATGTVTTLMFAGQSQTIPTDAAAVTVDSDGEFTMIIKVPDNAPWGWHPV
ncbi:IPT/TIG domain-containing protein, partial [Chloroflexota bacterium]